MATRPFRETPEVSAAIRRLVRATGKRIAEEDPSALAYLLSIENELNTAWRTAVDGLRRSGFADREIGDVIGVTRQAVQQRWPWEANAA